MSAEVSCGECGAPMRQLRGRFGPFWGCSRYPQCRGTHGAHPDGAPLGVPADEATKAARIRAHAAFDKLWSTPAQRGEAYRWLASELGIETSACHFASFDAATCERAIALCEARGGGHA